MERPKLHLFVDNSNVLLEARRFSETKRKRRQRLSAYLDDSYELDWGKFLYLVKRNDGRVLGDVPTLYGSRPPANDSVWQRIRDDGFDTKVFDRNIRNKEKGVDVEMALDISELILTKGSGSAVIVIAAGDADYVPAVERAKGKGWKVEVWFWSNAAGDLKASASEFVSLDDKLDYLRLGGGVPLP